MSIVSKENFIQLQFSHGDNISEESLNEINEWLSNAEGSISIDTDVTPDGVTFKFFESS